MKAKVVVFDFDGVLVRDSDALFKKEAWDIAFSRWKGRYETFLIEANQIYGSGKSGGRLEIIQYILGKLDVSEEEIPTLTREVSEVFDKNVQSKILEANLVPGSKELLQTLKDLGIIIYINSGTTTSALCRYLSALNVEHFFSGILGSTKEPHGGSKVDNLNYIGSKEKVDSSSILFIGDSESDYQAANKFNCHFIGISNIWNHWGEESKPFPVVTNLLDILKLKESFID